VTRANRDRVLLAGIGALCIIAGTLGLLQSFGALEQAGSAPVLLDDVRTFVDRNEATFWPVVAAVALVIAFLGARWLMFELRLLRRPAPWRISDDADSLLVDLSALADAVAADLEHEPGVAAADVTVTGRYTTPSADIRLAAVDDVSLRDLRETIGAGALSRLAAALEREDVEARVLVGFEPATRQLDSRPLRSQGVRGRGLAHSDRGVHPVCNVEPMGNASATDPTVPTDGATL
jgi:hypothetical protein